MKWNEPGYIYLITTNRSRSQYFFKIGWTGAGNSVGFDGEGEVERRRQSLQTGNPADLLTLAWKVGHIDHEHFMHKSIKNPDSHRIQLNGIKHYNREWFMAPATLGWKDLVKIYGRLYFRAVNHYRPIDGSPAGWAARNSNLAKLAGLFGQKRPALIEMTKVAEA